MPRLAHPAILSAISSVVLLATFSTPAHADEAQARQLLQERIQQLQQRVDQLNQPQTPAADVDAAVARVLADADRRSQLMGQEGFTAGYSGGRFRIQSADGSFLFMPLLHFQLRAVANSRDSAKPSGADETDSGFELRRTKWGFDGNAFGPNLQYLFLWGTDRKSGTPVLEDSWVRYRFAPQWSIRGGQFMDPVAHEQLTSTRKLMAADVSLVNQLISGGQTDYVQGVGLLYGGQGPWRSETAIHDGNFSRNTNFQDAGGSAFAAVNPPNWGVSQRVEYMAIGKDWRQYDDFTAWNDAEEMLVFGAGGDLTQRGRDDVFFHAIDAQYENPNGLALYGAYLGMYRQFGTVIPGQTENPYDWGFLLQASYLLNPKFEVFARYDFTHLAENAPGTAAAARVSNAISEYTIGANYYFHGHSAKLTADISWLPDGCPVPMDSLGYLQQSSGDSQVMARLQFQLVL